ncbi:feruloyl-CoA synthase [Acinetobacter baumannii]|uniref:feruloyl-CoA synthase n=1 Tax=Acinetobacter baumannii TaxID=470 RepID=UPI0023416520|nr:feruloyl-CoA synthase [Acinetobacter baumannii]MDC5075262.1 feruloyl-CoA synthase [Acinetobacter baumannii]MDK2108105.1 feruloyl-CoA synthase [Acinetobacter baumannii]MDK2113373.1 feruloyl-CoA synthase [Acinetobacter baumannii]MDK2142951.1 feruloyl-CoA synthase [Acinetobacter baumannii]MDK2153821.1 feruloyl-CoA synthase [Acinetobacter baumannii]
MKEMQMNATQSQDRERFVKLGQHDIHYHYKDQTLYISPKEQLKPYPQKLTDRLIHFAQTKPDHIFAAKRNVQGEWVKLSYAEVLQRAWHIAQALHDRNLSQERPLVILSGNDLEHLTLSMGAMLAGVPFSAISPAYSLISQDFGKLKHVFEVLTPGMVYASDGQAFTKAIQACITSDIEVVTNKGIVGDQICTSFQSLLDTPVSNVQEFYQTLDENQIAKFLFTSGSTKLPKAVPTTHLMLCVNQQMLLQTFPEFEETLPVLLDWLSWHHTFGGSHNVGIALYNGGTIYIDDGKPVAGKFDETIRNLKEISPTVYLNVPKGWEELTEALEKDEELRDRFFAKVKILFFAGAALSEAGWNRLDKIAQQHCGEKIRIMSGLGMTETAPSCAFTTGPRVMAGFIGYPAPGCEIKLVPCGDKLEFCVRGKHVMKGYWRLKADQQSTVFDDEGFFHTGDAVRLVDINDPTKGLMYDGRIAEDFKLNTGTFVNVGTLRNKVLIQGNLLIQDVCITGSNLNAIGFLIFPKLEACAQYAGLKLGDHSATEILQHPKVQQWFRQFLTTFNKDATGSSNTVSMLYLMTEPPQLDAGEVTDKGNLNQSSITKRRAALIDELYQKQTDNPLIIRVPTLKQ